MDSSIFPRLAFLYPLLMCLWEGGVGHMTWVLKAWRTMSRGSTRLEYRNIHLCFSAINDERATFNQIGVATCKKVPSFSSNSTIIRSKNLGRGVFNAINSFQLVHCIGVQPRNSGPELHHIQLAQNLWLASCQAGKLFEKNLNITRPRPLVYLSFFYGNKSAKCAVHQLFGQYLIPAAESQATLPELRNVKSFTRSKSAKPNFPLRSA